MRRFYIYTNDYKNVIDLESEILARFNLKKGDDYEIDVFDEDDRLITTISSTNRSTH
jgi:hypothetical protein